MSQLRGADILAQSLAQAGIREIFSLSGNHIMPVYDAALEARLRITHVRYEGAAVHMADAWGRLTGEVGVALLTGGPGHANGVGALYTALASESPVVLLSGHAPLDEVGCGSFQEMRQAEMAAPVTKASWTASSIETLGGDIARACRLARSGRPGPVHLSLPFDVLERSSDHGERLLAPPEAFAPTVNPLDRKTADAVRALLKTAKRPLILLGPVMAHAPAAGLAAELTAVAGVPAVCMEGPRGLNDAGLGAFAGMLAKADVIVLIGKCPDFSLRFGRAPAIAADCRFAVIDPEADGLKRAVANLGAARVVLSAQADTVAAVRLLIESAPRAAAGSAWRQEVADAMVFRPADWSTLAADDSQPVHPLAVGRAVQEVLDTSPESVLIADGGEFSQWVQASARVPARLINGPGGSIGSAVPFALAARMARPAAPVVAAMGDGGFGYHLMEFDTAVRAGLPFVVVVGNDACWNAEHQIQLRTYGRDRTHGCELLGTRYDLAAAALGGHGELVTRASGLRLALQRALASGKPACVNVMIQRLAAPVFNAAAPAAAAAH